VDTTEREIYIPASSQKSGIYADSDFIVVHEKLYLKSVLVIWLHIQRKWNQCLVFSHRIQTSLLSTVMLPWWHCHTGLCPLLNQNLSATLHAHTRAHTHTHSMSLTISEFTLISCWYS